MEQESSQRGVSSTGIGSAAEIYTRSHFGRGGGSSLDIVPIHFSDVQWVHYGVCMMMVSHATHAAAGAQDVSHCWVNAAMECIIQTVEAISEMLAWDVMYLISLLALITSLLLWVTIATYWLALIRLIWPLSLMWSDRQLETDTFYLKN